MAKRCYLDVKWATELGLVLIVQLWNRKMASSWSIHEVWTDTKADASHLQERICPWAVRCFKNSPDPTAQWECSKMVTELNMGQPHWVQPYWTALILWRQKFLPAMATSWEGPQLHYDLLSTVTHPSPSPPLPTWSSFYPLQPVLCLGYPAWFKIFHTYPWPLIIKIHLGSIPSILWSLVSLPMLQNPTHIPLPNPLMSMGEIG